MVETTNKAKRIMIIFHSMYGHVERLAQEIIEGINSIPGVKGELWRVEETLSKDVLTKMYAKDPNPNIPVLTKDKLDELKTADGFLFGSPSRFGMMSAQMKSFWDMTGGLWMSGALFGKPAGIFFSTSSQGGGQETVALTTVTQLAHHGMVFVPIGYAMGKEFTSNDEVRGGSPYGSGTLAGIDGSRQPSTLELKIARFQGSSFATFTSKLN